jgi:hypothetical protein
MGFFSRGKKVAKADDRPGLVKQDSMFINEGDPPQPLFITNEICPLSLLPLTALSSDLTRVFSCGHCFSTAAFVQHCSTLKITADASSFRCPICEANIKRVVIYSLPPPAPERGEDFYTFPNAISFKYYGKNWEIINPQSQYYRIKFPETMAEPSVVRSCFKEFDGGGGGDDELMKNAKPIFKDGVENHVFDLLSIPRLKARSLLSIKTGTKSTQTITIVGSHIK